MSGRKREIICGIRAKLKAMSLLKYQDRTKKELKERLMRAEFPEFITEGAVAYVESFASFFCH